MLGLAEYLALSAELRAIQSQYTTELVTKAEGLPKQDRVKLAKQFADTYFEQYKETLSEGLEDIAENALKYHANQLDLVLPKSLASDLVDELYDEVYYGATLNQRLGVLRKRVLRRAILQANISTDHIQNSVALKDPLEKILPAEEPAQRRVLLGSAAKLEQNAAVAVAEHMDAPFIRWALSHRHKQQDACDDLANNIDKGVVRELERLNSSANPKGLYFKDSVPPPPHPNCQCEYGVASFGKTTGGYVKRTKSKILSLLRKLARK